MDCTRFTLTTDLTNFMPLPRALLELPLPFAAVVLYGLLLDRGTYSRKNGYTEGDWVYVIYPVMELAETLGISTTSVKNHMKLLEEKGLIRRVRRSRTEANRIYLLVPQDAATATGRDNRRDKKQPYEGQKSSLSRERKVAPSNLKKQKNINELYQHKQEESL